MESLIEQLVENIKAKKVDSLTAMMVLQEAVHVARGEPNPKKAVEETLRRIAAGGDDLIPPKVVDDLVALLNTGLVRDVVDVLFTYGKRATWCCWRQ